MDSDFTPIMTVTSGARPRPTMPVIKSITFDPEQPLEAIISLTVGSSVAPELTTIKVKYGPTGSDLSAVPPLEFPGQYPSGSEQVIKVSVTQYGSEYDFQIANSD